MTHYHSHLSSKPGIHHYQIIKTIGKGQFGSVKLAIHTKTNEKVNIFSFIIIIFIFFVNIYDCILFRLLLK